MAVNHRMGAWIDRIMPKGIATCWPKWASASGVPSNARLPKPAAMEAAAPPETFNEGTRRETKAAATQVTASPPKKAIHKPQGAACCGSMVATVLNSRAGMATLNTKSEMPRPAAASKIRAR